MDDKLRQLQRKALAGDFDAAMEFVRMLHRIEENPQPAAKQVVVKADFPNLWWCVPGRHYVDKNSCRLHPS